MWYILAGVASICVATAIATAKRRRGNPAQPIDRLKNALLALALARVHKDDIESSSRNYSAFDGSKLPMLAGASIDNACFSYIVDKNEFRNDPWHTSIMEDKVDAIQKFIDKHLDNDAAIIDFFLRFLGHLSPRTGETIRVSR